MITNFGSGVNRYRGYRSEERRGSNSKVKSVTMLVSSSGWKNRKKIKLRDESRKRRGVGVVRQIHLNIEITSKDHRALLVGKESE